MAFCPFDHVEKGDLGSDFFGFGQKFVNIGLLYFYVDRRILHKRQNTVLLAYSPSTFILYSLSVLSMHAKIFLAYSETISYV